MRRLTTDIAGKFLANPLAVDLRTYPMVTYEAAKLLAESTLELQTAASSPAGTAVSDTVLQAILAAVPHARMYADQGHTIHGIRLKHDHSPAALLHSATTPGDQHRTTTFFTEFRDSFSAVRAMHVRKSRVIRAYEDLLQQATEHAAELTLQIQTDSAAIFDAHGTPIDLRINRSGSNTVKDVIVAFRTVIEVESYLNEERATDSPISVRLVDEQGCNIRNLLATIASTESLPQSHPAAQDAARLQTLLHQLEFRIGDCLLQGQLPCGDAAALQELLNTIHGLDQRVLINKFCRGTLDFPLLTEAAGTSEQEQLLVQKKNVRHSQKWFTFSWLRKLSHELIKRNRKESAALGTKHILKAIDAADSASTSPLSSRLQTEQTILLHSQEYLSRNDKLKFLIHSIGDRHNLRLSQKSDLLQRLTLLSDHNPKYADILQKYPDFPRRIEDFQHHLWLLRHVPGIDSIIRAAGALIDGRTDTSEYICHVYGFLCEASFNVKLISKGYTPIEFATSMPLPFSNLNANDRYVKYKRDFASRNQQQLQNRRRNQWFSQPDESASRLKKRQIPQEIDAVFRSPQSEILFIEHKINLSTLLKKKRSTMPTPTHYNQLKNLLQLAAFHHRIPVLMVCTDEVIDQNGTIIPHHPLMLQTKAIIQTAQKDSPHTPPLRILDSNVNNITPYFS